MLRRASSFYLLVASFFSAIGLYLFYIKYRLLVFQPSLDVSKYLSLYGYLIHPELDMVLYVTAVVFIPVVGILFYFLLHGFIRRFSDPIQTTSSRLFLELVLILDVVLCYLLVSPYGLSKLPGLYVLYVSFYAVLVIIIFIIPYKLFKFLNYLEKTVSLFLLATIYLVDVTLFFLLFFNLHFVNNLLINYFRTGDTYPFFNGFTQWQLLLVAGFISLLIWLWFKPAARIASLTKKSYFKYFVDIAVFFLLVFLVSIVVMNGWGNPLYVIVRNYNSFAGPVNDVLGGKTLLVDVNSQYGILLVYVLAQIFKVVPLTYTNMFWLNYAVMVTGYYLVYLIMRKWLGWVAVIGISLIMLHHYFGQSVSPLLYTQQTFIRWGWWLLLFIVIQKKLSLLIEFIIVSFSLFWAFDSGMYVLLAYLVFSIVRIYLSCPSWTARIKKVIFTGVGLLVTLTVCFILISFFTRIRAGMWPNWRMGSAMAGEFTGGFGLLPMPAIGPYIIVLTLYLAVFTYIIFQLLSREHKLSKERTADLCLISYITAYGISLFIYYTGRSTNCNLLTVTIPFIVVLCWALTRFKKNIIDNKNKLFIGGLAFFFLISSGVSTTVALVNLKNIYLGKDRLIPLGFDDIENIPPYKQSIAAINSYLEAISGKTRKVAIVSTWDGFFLVKTKSVNIIDSNDLENFIRYSQLTDLANQVRDRSPEIIFVDNADVGNVWEMAPRILANLQDQYHFEKNVGYLDIWRRN
jgi:hypothetical protein